MIQIAKWGDGCGIAWWHRMGDVPAGITAQGRTWRFWVEFGPRRDWIPLGMSFRQFGPVTLLWGKRNSA